MSKWTKTDEQKLIELQEKATSLEQISEGLRRSIPSIKTRLISLRLINRFKLANNLNNDIFNVIYELANSDGCKNLSALLRANSISYGDFRYSCVVRNLPFVNGRPSKVRHYEWNNEAIDFMKSLYDRGEKVKDIAKIVSDKFDISKSAVLNRIYVDCIPNRYTPIDDSIINKIFELHNSGEKIIDICNQLNVNIGKVLLSFPFLRDTSANINTKFSESEFEVLNVAFNQNKNSFKDFISCLLEFEFIGNKSINTLRRYFNAKLA